MSAPEPKKLTITVQMYHFATARDKKAIYSTPRQIECWSDESLFEKLNRVVPAKFWCLVYDETNKVWVQWKSSDDAKRSQVDDLQERLMQDPKYKPTFYIWDSRTNTDINDQRPVGPDTTGRVAHLSTLLTQLNAGLQRKA